jgi:tRNA dimethylallyltransferase
VAPLLRDSPVAIVGGTGLYFTALTEGLAEIPPVPPAVRAEAGSRLAEGGLAALVADLDPATAARTDLLNPVRVQRAWEVLRATGRGLADWQARTAPPLLRADAAERLLVMPDRDASAARILHRLRAMVAVGALEEVAAELPHWDPARPSGKAIGVAEFAAHLRGEMTLEAAILGAATATRQYAKRQRSWFRGRMADWRRIAAP